MNDEPSSSSARAYPHTEDGHTQPEAAPTAAELAERRKKNRQMFNKKRGELLDDLLRNFDILIYAELSAIYYMDCSFLRFIFRAFVQFMFLTPKPPMFPDHPADKPIIGAVLGSNAICLLLHLWFSPPSAGEATRGYLHGGLAMDFIGQKGPTSKLHLLSLDLLLVLLQVTHMAAAMLRRRLKVASATTTSTSDQATPATAPELRQDLDSEERGVRRSDEAQDIEMQTLNSSGTTTSNPDAVISTEESAEHDALLATTVPRTDAHIFDAFNSGQIVLADLDLWKCLKEQVHLVRTYQRDAQSDRDRSLRAQLAARVLRMRFGTDALRQSLS